MDGPRDSDTPWDVITPSAQTLPLVLASPHSGRRYPPKFVAASRLDPMSLRRSEDSFVDEIFAAGPARGAPLLRALFPRAFVDPNREPFELDPRMFEDELPDYINPDSPRVAAGLGTIARVVATGQDIYANKLTAAEALWRIEAFYHPYHAALQGLVDRTVECFRTCLVVDCHSMPSVGGPTDLDPGRRRVDFVLGDCFGASCHPSVTAAAEAALTGMGYTVARNVPYAGGFTTRSYGCPKRGVHALQLEVNRALYMHETNLERKPGISWLAQQMGELVTILGGVAFPPLEVR
jgi:N-formylglutamate amidohydrolase